MPNSKPVITQVEGFNPKEFNQKQRKELCSLLIYLAVIWGVAMSVSTAFVIVIGKLPSQHYYLSTAPVAAVMSIGPIRAYLGRRKTLQTIKNAAAEGEHQY